MIIERMIEGEVVRRREIPSRLVPLSRFPDSPMIDVVASRYYRRVKRLLWRRGDFVESGAVDPSKGANWSWIVTNCGDNCLKFSRAGMLVTK